MHRNGYLRPTPSSIWQFIYPSKHCINQQLGKACIISASNYVDSICFPDATDINAKSPNVHAVDLTLTPTFSAHVSKPPAIRAPISSKDIDFFFFFQFSVGRGSLQELLVCRVKSSGLLFRQTSNMAFLVPPLYDFSVLAVLFLIVALS